MKDAEKKLIENLFNRLKKTELNSSERDNEANSLIQDLVKKQPYSSYYMTQTILIQETAIKKLSLKLEELTNQISNLSLNKTTKKPSFLSSFFKKSPTSSDMFNNNIWKKDQNSSGNYHPLSSSSPTISSNNGNSGNSGFLKNALQTATGVAGGMILGNMLMNVFNHSKPEEEVFNTINESSIYNIENHELNPDNENNLIDYDNENHFYTSENTSNFDDDHINDINDDMNNTSDINDINDDNFI
ncbi:DUF2076 domain-containing protein [Buchnera aphidicola (Aphis fabae)]|uniref:DUF2076 domain-containing protein n=1 Tax=Buchnera aphidicola (Aphis fabae) TaxID=571430 RepID=A0A5J6ZC01_9GAMM|nr:DUF2076 domain-containing protein [Buchnera aphidicola]QFQ32914.1 DUF2076 domain-containing protein [Buchnera aphidicola (Aphis fabae)]